MNRSVNSELTNNGSLIEKGQVVYEKQLKASLEPRYSGQFVAIEPLSGRYFLGKTATSALVAARNAMPESQFFLTRVGSTSAHKISGYGSRIGSS